MKNNKLFEQFGLKLADFRSKKGESITDVANSIGIDRSHLSKLENGHERPSLEVLHRLISHYSLSRVEATELSNLSGYQGENQVVIEIGKREEVNIMNDNQKLPEIGVNKPGVNVNVSNNTVVLYTDSVFITTNKFGIVFDFAQSMGPTNQQNVVSRIGMSREHAKMLRDALDKNLKDSEEKK